MTRILSALIAFLVAFNAYGQGQPSIDAQYRQEVNVTTNAGFENGLQGWSKVGAGATFAITTSEVGFGKASASFDASANNDALKSPQVAVPKILRGNKCEASVYYKGGDTNLTLQAFDGTSALTSNTVTLGVAAEWTRSPKVYFTCPSSGTVGLRVLAGANAAVAYFDQAFVGIQAVSSSVVVTSPQTYALTVGGSTSAPTLGTNTVSSTWQRDGDEMIIRYSLNQTVAGSAGSGTYLFPLPGSGAYTINPALLLHTGTASLSVVGPASVTQTANVYPGTVNVYNSTNLMLVIGSETAAPAIMASTNYSFATATMRVSFIARVPIAEWAGQGVLYTAAGGDVEYAYNSTTTTGGNLTAFAYGPNGGQFPNVTQSLGAGVQAYRVRFQTPIQATDKIIFETQVTGSGPWLSLDMSSSRVGPFSYNGGNWTGVIVSTVNSTDVDVKFGTAGASNTGVYGSGTAGNYNTWADLNAGGDRWRLKKISASQVSGFNSASTTASGFVDTTTQSFAGAKTFTGGISVTGSAMPYVRAYVASSATTYNTTPSIIGWTEAADTVNAFASNTFTAPSAGRYLFTIAFNTANVTSSPTAVTGYLKVNGTVVSNRFPYIKHGATALVVNESGAAAITLDLAASDAVTFFAATDVGTVTFDTDTYSMLTITKLY